MSATTAKRSARVEIDIDADPTTVFDFLVEPRTYPDWLVGAQDMRFVETAWPEPGARFHHRVGFGPLHVKDHTTVVSIDAPRELVLEASIGPFGSALVTFHVDGSATTHLTLDEVPHAGPIRWVGTFCGRLLLKSTIWGRNQIAVQQLKSLVEAGRPATAT